MQIQITLRSVVIGVALGLLVVGIIYGCLFYKKYQQEQIMKAFEAQDAKDAQADVVWDEKDGVITVSPVAK